MTKDDIIRMAREAGIEYSKNLNQIVSPYCDGVHMDELEKFINIVAAAEREACARLCDDMSGPIEIYNPAYVHYIGCAEAIRAMGQ